MKQVTIYIISLCFLNSCIEKPKVPENLIQPQKMGEIMSDLLVLEDAVYQQGLQGDSAKKIFLGQYKPYLLDSLKVDVQLFDSSYNYYVANPVHFAEAMKVAREILEKKQ